MPRARPAVSTTIGDTANRPLLRFDVRKKALEQRLASFTGRAVPVTGEGLNLSIGGLFSTRERGIIAGSRAVEVAVNRVIRNAAERGLQHIRKVSRDTYETGAFYSNWRYELKADSSGLKANLSYTNPVPYAKYVHRSGTPRSHTVYNKHVKPYVIRKLQKEIIDDLTKLLPRAIREQLFGAA